jgi:hypothetical protein
MIESSRTILDFPFKDDMQPILEKWADANRFVMRQADNGASECQRGGGMLMCPVLLQIRQTGGNIHLETWLQVDILTEFTTLFNAPTQSAIQSGGTLLWREKDLARMYVNQLLRDLHQPPIP